MAHITQIVDGIYHIEHADGNASRCSVYLVAGEPGALVETGPSAQVPGILDALHSIGYDPNHITYIIPSHLHADHAGGTGYLAQQLPRSKVVAHEQGAHHLVEPSKLIAGTRQAFGEDFEAEFGPIVPVVQEQLMVVKGGETLDLGGRSLELLYTPGHTLNSMSIFERTSRGLFCGDSLGTQVAGRVVLPQAFPTQFDLEATLETFDRLEALNPSILYISHFGPARDVALAFRTAREVVLTWKDVALEALRAGQPAEVIVDRFHSLVDGYVAGETSPYAPEPLRHMLSLIVTGYSLYFQRKGLL